MITGSRGRTAAGLALAATALGGCGGPAGGPEPSLGQAIQRKIREEAKPSTLTFRGTKGNSFRVDDEQGRRILEAQVATVDGAVQPGKGLQGPVRLKQAKCRLFQGGRPSLDLQSPEFTWDGKELKSEQAAHAVTADGSTIIDAGRATWTAAGGVLELEQAKLQSRRGGRVDFTAEGPRARVAEGIVLLTEGAVARGDQGHEMRARRVRWELRTARLEATGGVEVRADGTTVSGERLLADTRLKRGRFTGKTKVRIRK